MAIEAIFHFNVNCRDLKRSRAFFEKVGFKVHRITGGDTRPESDKAMARKALHGQPYDYDGVLMTAGNFRLNLLHYTKPVPADLPPKGPTDYGLVRVCFQSSNIDSDYARMKAEGVEFISEPVDWPWEGRRIRWCSFRDPDGNLFQLATLFPA